MPTITLSWSDVALFVVTAGLVGSILYIGRSTTVSSNLNTPSNEKKTAASKKKKKSKKGAIITPPAATSPSNNPSNNSAQSSVPTPSTILTKVITETPSTQIQSPAVTQLVEKPVNQKLEADFPPLSATNQSQTKKQAANQQRPFAERHLQPARKTIVDDMIDHDVEKPLKISRVMNIVNPTPQVPLSPISDPEEGWEKVLDSKPKRSRNTNNSININPSTSHQTPSTASQPSQQKPSKRQRQNAKKKEALKALKVADEADRLRQLALHKKTQERHKINTQSSSSATNKPVGKQISGGMKSTIGEDGRLIWE